MDEKLLEEFHQRLSQFQGSQGPDTKEKTRQLLAELSVLLGLAERIMMYLATHKDSSEDMLTYLFEYKQLLRLEIKLRDLLHSLPENAPVSGASLTARPWWKFWGSKKRA